ncbi:MAG TPA: DNA-processing protein DprA [Polyangia bacterium]|nr:DNA-processing protein DprA [Polyangia bacterium]
MPADPADARLVPASSAEFPDVLRAVKPAIAALWVRGALPGAASRRLGIVGARAASRAGCRRTQELAAMAARRGFTIVSGGALGIDAAAHRGALAAGAPTFAVLGCGVDVVYPDRHAALFAEIAGAGGLLSEFPLGTPPRGRQFPSRNRIVAALSEMVLVVEAQEASGALVTARLALEMRRPLLAVPGSPGTDRLLAAGKARPVRDGAELLARLDGATPAPAPPPAELGPLIAALSGGATAAEVGRRLGLPIAAALALLSEAELGGWILRGAGGVFTSIEVTRAN